MQNSAIGDMPTHFKVTTGEICQCVEYQVVKDLLEDNKKLKTGQM